MRLCLTAAVLSLGLVLAACSSPVTPEAEPVGLFDDAPYLPALASAQSGNWQFLQTGGMQCRDGSRTGFGLRRRSGSPNLLILLQGGGACYDFFSCLTNRSSFDRDDFDDFIAEFGNAGVFEADNADNPFGDWNVIFVPYCTGDVHSGDAPNTVTPGVFGRQDFVGYSNMESMLGRIAGQAKRARKVVLAGESAGGFGVLGTYGLVADELAPAPIDFLNDSGPVPADDDVLSPSLQKQWRDLWNLDAALPEGCTDCSLPNGDGLENVTPFYAAQNPDRSFGLISTERDFVIRTFFGFPSASAFEDGLYDIRASLPPGNSGTYFPAGEGHTFLLSSFYTSSINGTSLASWTEAFVNGEPFDLPAVRPAAAPVAVAE
ncbi:MAG: pectin acetylesterase-family hydrolase [Bacteroidota bacterium]